LSGEGGVGTLDGLQLVHLQGLMDILWLSGIGVINEIQLLKLYNEPYCSAEGHNVKYMRG
jgi:hypothetical protein